MDVPDAMLAHIHPLLLRTDPQLKMIIWKHIYCVPPFEFVYFRVPKAANSTITAALHMNLPAADRARKDKRAGQQFGRSGIWTMRQLERKFTFTFVRNPFVRVLSCYLDKVAEGNPKFTSLLGGDVIDFGAFLSKLEAGALRTNGHWAPQAELIPVAPEKLAFIGRVESIGTDLPAVLTRIFGNRDYKMPPSPFRTTSADHKLSDYYGKAETARVRRLYTSDFALFYPDACDP